MSRKEFFNQNVLLGNTFILPNHHIVANTLLNNGIDKLWDSTGQFALPPLPYATSALEPFIDEETLFLHYNYHHKDAVIGANDDQQLIRDALANNDMALANYWVKKAAYHFTDHVLHTIYWTNLINSKNKPAGRLLQKIEKQFGSFDAFKKLVTSTARLLNGNGWIILAYQPYNANLVIMQCKNHEELTQWSYVPLLAIDIWEHSYYLKYKNKKADFIEATLKIINWDNVAMRLDAASKINYANEEESFIK